MIGKPAGIRAALSILIFLFYTSAQAQPLLPDMAGISDRGVNFLTWTCQYDGIKSIAVQRSADSTMNFATVGYVKNLKKGVQVFADGHPLPGNNYYQLFIVFNSDLSWTGNHIKLYVDSTLIKNRRIKLPSNDSLQRYLTTTIGNKEPEEEKKKSHPGTVTNNNVVNAATDTATYSPYGSINAKKKKTVIVVGTKDADVVTSLDSSQKRLLISNDSLVKKQPKIIIRLTTNVTDLDPYNYVRSQYVSSDDLTGNINITLPDVKFHSYSMRIYNGNKMIMDIPRFTASPIILDKRNFHQSGLYKFTIKRDNKEFESGNVSVSLD